jgi:uncharacterized membrane protein YeiH
LPLRPGYRDDVAWRFNEEILIYALLVAFDVGWTFIFVLSGAAAGVKNRVDGFGALVLSFAVGNSGGIARDLMIGGSAWVRQEAEPYADNDVPSFIAAQI